MLPRCTSTVIYSNHDIQRLFDDGEMKCSCGSQLINSSNSSSVVQKESRQSHCLFFYFPPSDSFDQHHGRPGLGLVGTVVCAFGVVGAWASQVQKAEACFQAKALLDAGSRAGVGGGGVGCGAVVQIPLCTFCPVTYNTGEGR